MYWQAVYREQGCAADLRMRGAASTTNTFAEGVIPFGGARSATLERMTAVSLSGNVREQVLS
ncbi:hypothetical protein SAMN05216466_101118 [Paraburkholderia phenazinium]|jgi:hypothetical protein|uniref:Uncharacterized protein n=1 Tax=Paraburkholderia phenazinium TaxID=60549 RepID=A0A1G7P167_9BURK|nr:hypothetical protein SAMN05216466_101118 [Paraburkholderia phenazinium]